MRNRAILLETAVAAMLAGAYLGFFAPAPQNAAQQPGARGGWGVWTASAMERVGQKDPPVQQTDVSLSAARGEYEPFQIIVSAGQEPVTGVNVEASDLFGPGGSKIDRANLVLFREHYIQVVSPSPDPGQGNRPLGRGWYADALVPFQNPETGRPVVGEIQSAPFDVGANANQPVWVDVYVPFDTRPGVYNGSVYVSGSQGGVSVPVQLRVWDFVLPLRPTLKSSFGMHAPNSRDRRVHEVLLRHRLMPESVNERDSAGLAEQFGLNTTALQFGGNFIDGSCTMDAAPPSGKIASALQAYPPDLPVYIYPADEIDRCPGVFWRIREWAASMHAASSRIKNLVTVSPTPALYSDGTGTGRSAVDIWVLLPSAYVAAGSQVKSLQAKGDEVWSYTALTQDTYSPKWEIDFAPINYRIQPGFISQSLGLTGILYWRIDLWNDSPFRDVSGYSNQGNFYPGEGMLVYPGRQLGLSSVIPSMRLKWIREGVEDFEYIAILKRLGREAWALNVCRQAGADWENWTRDFRVLERVRRQLGDEIERLSTGLDTEQGRVR